MTVVAGSDFELEFEYPYDNFIVILTLSTKADRLMLPAITAGRRALYTHPGESIC